MITKMEEIPFEGTNYQISFEAMPEALKERLTKKELGTYLSLLQKVQLEPKKVYQKVKSFCETYKEIPEVLNLLTFAHIQNHRIVEAENLIEETYNRFPDYFFARINYADQCIRKKKLDLVLKIFPTFDLQELYPGKTLYHTSEFRGFMVMMTYFERARKNRDKALHYFKTAKQIEPNHPGVLYLEKKLFKTSLLKKLREWKFWLLPR
jgi:tetratricopeptide (TPR) repeat protein